METKHTKGNWKVYKSNESPNTFCTDLRVIVNEPDSGLYKDTICSFHHLPKKYSEGFNREIVEENAKLIAATPEILEMLNNAINLLKKIDGKIHYSLAIPYETIIKEGTKLIEESTT